MQVRHVSNIDTLGNCVLYRCHDGKNLLRGKSNATSMSLSLANNIALEPKFVCEMNMVVLFFQKQLGNLVRSPSLIQTYNTLYLFSLMSEMA